MPNITVGNELLDEFKISSEFDLTFRKKFINKLVAEHVNPTENKLPSLIFDFRYMRNQFPSFFFLQTAIEEFYSTVSVNNRSHYPFKIKLYNYFEDTDFHKDFPNTVNFLDYNLIDVYSQSYLVDFPKEQLVYLSKDAEQPMEEYDASKTYIIGSIIEHMPNQKLASLYTAKAEKIVCQHLPINKYMT